MARFHFSRLFFVIVAYVIVTAPWAIFFVLHFTTASHTLTHTRIQWIDGVTSTIFRWSFWHHFIHSSATHTHKIMMHLVAAFYCPAFVAIISDYWHLPFWMFIDLRGPTLKTLHACTGVSTGKNGQSRCVRDATVKRRSRYRWNWWAMWLSVEIDSWVQAIDINNATMWVGNVFVICAELKWKFKIVWENWICENLCLLLIFEKKEDISLTLKAGECALLLSNYQTFRLSSYNILSLIFSMVIN